MTVLQVWWIAGIPCLALALLCLVRRHPLAALLGYVFLGVGFAIVVTVDRASGAVFAAVLVFVVASGRGGPMEREPTEPAVLPDEVRRPARGR